MTENKVNVIDTKEKGHCLVANEDVSQGDILLISKPYGIIPSIRKTNKVCANCFDIFQEQIDTKKMISCRQNCLHVFYCSNKCEEEQWNKFHQYECSFLDRIKDYNDKEYIINYTLLVMRLLTQRFNDILYKSEKISIEDVFILLSHNDEFRRIAKLLTEYVLTKLISQLCQNNDQIIHIIQSFLPDNTDIKQVEITNCDLWLIDMIH
ncbi:hypothetical protein I4U23_017066 [Adineta vaga]|nr:hypothetical protein I4U23_017066 [Adineta vaga]